MRLEKVPPQDRQHLMTGYVEESTGSQLPAPATRQTDLSGVEMGEQDEWARRGNQDSASGV